jgi:hypothetical protein
MKQALSQQRKRRWPIYAVLIAGTISFVIFADHQAKQDQDAEATYLKGHPPTDKQLAANKHFNTCWQYRHAPASVWSDKQRRMMIDAEGCYSDDRDDPRYNDASYPWNANAPTPWKNN